MEYIYFVKFTFRVYGRIGSVRCAAVRLCLYIANDTYSEYI